MTVDSGLAGEGRVVGIPNFHPWSKCTMPLANINLDWMSNASSGLCIIWPEAVARSIHETMILYVVY